MKRKILSVLFMFLLATILVACQKPTPTHNIKVKEIETIVKWTEIEFIFDIEGEDDDNKIADGSLFVDLYKDNKVIVNRTPGKNAESHYRAVFTTLQLDTEYDLVVTASINQKKVELYKATIKTLLDGGQESNPLMINSVEDFANITNMYAFYKLGQDLDFEGKEISTPFLRGLRGQFDGGGFKLKNFTVPYVNYNGIFGNMNTGTPVVKNLVIEDVTYNNSINIENKVTTSLYVGLLTREIATGAKVENITFNNINMTILTETYGIRYFGLVTAANRGKIENITLNNVNFDITFNNVNEGHIGAVAGKHYSSGKLSKINYASGNFNILAQEYVSNPQNVYSTYFGTIVGESTGSIEEAYSAANINLVEKDLGSNQKVVTVEGDYFEVRAASLEEGVSIKPTTFVNNDEEVSIKFNAPLAEKVLSVTLNGVDKTAELVDDTLVVPASAENLLVKVSYQKTDETAKLTLTGVNFDILEAKLGEEVVYNGSGEKPTEWSFGTVFKIKGKPTFGKLASIKVNGVSFEMTNSEIIFTITKNTKVEVYFTSTKSVYIGGIAGATSSITNSVYSGDITQNNQVSYKYYEQYHVGGLVGALYGKINQVAVYGLNISVSNHSPLRAIDQSRIFGTKRAGAEVGMIAVVSSSIELNGAVYDDGFESLSSVPENLFTSEFIKQFLPK